MKRKIIVASLAACLVAVLGVGTWAYFTATATATNVVTVGDVSIRLVDRVDEQAAHGMAPGQSVSKTVFVENDGSNPAWVRVRLDVDVRSADGEALSADPVTLHAAAPKAWVDGGDGWRYLSTALAAGASSVALVDAVSLDSAAGNEYAGAQITVTAYAQAVQSKNNGASYGDVRGWPEG